MILSASQQQQHPPASHIPTEIFSRMGFLSLTPVQQQAFGAVISPEGADGRLIPGRDVLILSPTGTGKTAAYTAPIVHELLRNHAVVSHWCSTLIIVPRPELSHQVNDSILQLSGRGGVRTADLSSAHTLHGQIQLLQRGVDVAIGTPDRIADLIRQGVITKDTFSGLRRVVLDEFDELAQDMYERSIADVLSVCPIVGKRQTVIVSATMSERANRIIGPMQHDPERIVVGTDQILQNVAHYAVRVPVEQKIEALASLLRSHPQDQALVFVNWPEAAANVALELKNRMPECADEITFVASGIDKFDRRTRIAGFRDHTYRVVVATNILSRGFDQPKLPFVVNFHLPYPDNLAGLEADYTHRSGRTGRMGHGGVTLSLIDQRDERALAKLLGLQKFPITEIDSAAIPTIKVPSDRPGAAVIAAPVNNDAAGQMNGKSRSHDASAFDESALPAGDRFRPRPGFPFRPHPPKQTASEQLRTAERVLDYEFQDERNLLRTLGLLPYSPPSSGRAHAAAGAGRALMQLCLTDELVAAHETEDWNHMVELRRSLYWGKTAWLAAKEHGLTSLPPFGGDASLALGHLIFGLHSDSGDYRLTKDCVGKIFATPLNEMRAACEPGLATDDIDLPSATVQAVENLTGFRFGESRLLARALSFQETPEGRFFPWDNRLQILGDAVIRYAISEFVRTKADPDYLQWSEKIGHYLSDTPYWLATPMFKEYRKIIQSVAPHRVGEKQALSMFRSLVGAIHRNFSPEEASTFVSESLAIPPITPATVAQWQAEQRERAAIRRSQNEPMRGGL